MNGEGDVKLDGDIDIDKIKSKGRFRRFISKILNFFCALIIFAVVLFAIGAFMQADVQSKNILGNYDYQIFSYNRTDDGIAELKAFGESLVIDLNKLYEIKERFDEVAEVNKDYTPSIITISGDLLNICISSVSGSFKKIPDIINYFITLPDCHSELYPRGGESEESLPEDPSQAQGDSAE